MSGGNEFCVLVSARENAELVARVAKLAIAKGYRLEAKALLETYRRERIDQALVTISGLFAETFLRKMTNGMPPAVTSDQVFTQYPFDPEPRG